MELVSNIIVAIAALGAFIMSAISIILTLNQRADPIREHLYEKQLAYFIGLMEVLELVDDSVEILASNITEENYDYADEKILELYSFLAIGDLLIPDDEMYDLSVSTFKKYRAIGNHIRAILDKSIEYEESTIKELEKSAFDTSDDFIQEMRDFIGVDKLSAKHRRLIED